MINDYDKFAKERQSELLKGQKFSHRFVEKPMMKSMMPNLSNKKVLMIGCGTGEESILLKEFGAKDITGIDLSKKSIALAKQTYSDIKFEIGDMNNLNFEDESFDFVYSSLVIHYSNKPKKVYNEIYRVLKKDGKMLFSIGHPLRWAGTDVKIDNVDIKLIGFAKSKDIGKIYGNYHTPTKNLHHFKNNEVLSFYTASPSFHFKNLKEVGFDILDFTESKCIEEAKNIDLNYYNKFSEIPQFMAFLVQK